MHEVSLFKSLHIFYRPRKVNLGEFGQNSDAAMFDFLKDGKHAEKKYKSTNQIPYLFSSHDLFNNNNAHMSTAPETFMEHSKDEVFTPFFSIEEDCEMEDEISNSDGYASEIGQESLDSDKNIEFKGKLKVLNLV